MLGNLGHQVGIATFSAYHATHSLTLSKEGFSGHCCKPGSSSGFFQLKNTSTCGSSTSDPQRSPSVDCDQSAVSGATDGGRQSFTSTGCYQSVVLGVAFILESKLDSSKVTHLLGHTGLVEGSHLLVASPGWPTRKGCPPMNPPMPSMS